MTYIVTKNKQESLVQLERIISAFEKEYSIYKSDKYKEAQLRIDFLNPLLKSFGWDVDNENGKSQFLRDVIQEESIDVQDDNVIRKKNPDYTLRINGIRKFFIEAKNVTINLKEDKKAAFQTRRYGWNANLGISIVTNFETLVVYDCRYKPDSNESSSVARYKVFNYKDYVKCFDELYELLSHESISNGFIDDYFSNVAKEVSTFDDDFLKQIESWRGALAREIIANNKNINNEEINLLIQRLLNRIIFLRICEDREIEKFETLKKIKSYEELKELFLYSDKKYNSGLFSFIEDNFDFKIELNSDLLLNIFSELYYPQSPYDFSVVDSEILSHIYERYLGSKVFIDKNNQVSIIEEPEVIASNGVVPTPKIVVKTILNETLLPLFEEKSLEEIFDIKIADICCGSGTFLISAYDLILEKLINILKLETNINEKFIYKSSDEVYQLTLNAKNKILTSCLYGVDINPYAVEVTKFSLFLKILEDENYNTIENYLSKYNNSVLPNLDHNIKCGNSLVDEKYYEFNSGILQDDELLFKIKPFCWNKEFPFLIETKGFDAIIGNPPYVRIQNIIKYSSEEIQYYNSKMSKYNVSNSKTFDKYYLFIQRAIELLNDEGVLGYIIPSKFFTIKSGEDLRRYIIESISLYKIIYFGTFQVFPKRSTYTVILILDKKKAKEILFKKVNRSTQLLSNNELKYDSYDLKDFTFSPWMFISKETRAVFDKINTSNVQKLGNISDISVGLQTSKDPIYIFTPISETDKNFVFKYKNEKFEIEKSICKPCIYKLSFDSFDSISHNAQIIFPYKIIDGRAEVYSERELEDKFNLAWNYLNRFKDVLSKRSVNGKDPKWYQFGRSQSLTKFHRKDKLIWPVLSTKPNYVLDNKDIQFTGGGNGPYYSLLQTSEYSLYYIMGLLQHPIIEAMIKASTSEFRGDYYSHGKQFMENLPIAIIDFEKKEDKELYHSIESIVKDIILNNQKIETLNIASKKKLLNDKNEILNSLLLEKVNEVYGITNEDISIIEKDEMLTIKTSEE
ncbi:MAG: N-6 DNA methylase [Flavobacteriaceae bacterium]|jgi:hypothetical protein|nr:N-6 DNA methylase [Flavobacteriaceae bacterium]